MPQTRSGPNVGRAQPSLFPPASTPTSVWVARFGVQLSAQHRSKPQTSGLHEPATPKNVLSRVTMASAPHGVVPARPRKLHREPNCLGCKGHQSAVYLLQVLLHAAMAMACPAGVWVFTARVVAIYAYGGRA
jgi:hypothetical protein